MTDLIAAAIVGLALVNVLAGGGVRRESVAGVAVTQLDLLLQVAELLTLAQVLAPLPLPRHAVVPHHHHAPRHLAWGHTVSYQVTLAPGGILPFQVPF